MINTTGMKNRLNHILKLIALRDTFKASEYPFNGDFEKTDALLCDKIGEIEELTEVEWQEAGGYENILKSMGLKWSDFEKYADVLYQVC